MTHRTLFRIWKVERPAYSKELHREAIGFTPLALIVAMTLAFLGGALVVGLVVR